jgi:hypothetical protein
MRDDTGVVRGFSRLKFSRKMQTVYAVFDIDARDGADARVAGEIHDCWGGTGSLIREFDVKLNDSRWFEVSIGSHGLRVQFDLTPEEARDGRELAPEAARPA